MKLQAIHDWYAIARWFELFAGVEHQWGISHRADCDIDIQTAENLAQMARKQRLPPLFVNASLGVILSEPDRFLDLLQASKTPHSGAIGIELTEHGVESRWNPRTKVRRGCQTMLPGCIKTSPRLTIPTRRISSGAMSFEAAWFVVYS